MANINPEENYIQIEETRFRAPVSEATLTRMGASINFLLDKIPFNVQKIEFLSSQTWVAPSNALFGIVEGVGGGGGGAASTSFPRASGGGGSSGYFTQRPLELLPNISYTVIIGAGGAGGASNSQPGSNGLQSQFGSIIFPGGIGGEAGQLKEDTVPGGKLPQLVSHFFQRSGYGIELHYGLGPNYTFYRRPLGGGLLGTFGNPNQHKNAGMRLAVGGSGGADNIKYSFPYSESGFAGENFFEFSGGAAGLSPGNVAGGGGGAAGPYGVGASGGNGNANGSSASANTGAGGGGAGANASGVSLGGAGGSGRVVLWLFTKA